MEQTVINCALPAGYYLGNQLTSVFLFILFLIIILLSVILNSNSYSYGVDRGRLDKKKVTKNDRNRFI